MQFERYAPSVPDRGRIVVARPGDLDGPYLDPGVFALYSPEQYARVGFPFAPYDRDLTHPCVRGWWLGSGEPVWVHAVFVYLSIEVRRDQLICQGSSNGLAASTSTDEASLRATIELVERDALMYGWLTATPAEAADVRDMLDHAAYYFPVERRHVFDRLRHGGTPIAFGDLMGASQSAVATCGAVLDHAGIRVAIVDVTSPDVRTGPFRVARAVSPDLQGISYGFGLDRRPVSRIVQGRVTEVPAVHPIW